MTDEIAKLNNVLGGIMNENRWWDKNSGVWLAEELFRRGVRVCGDPERCGRPIGGAWDR